MKCPLCGSKVTYEGMNNLECDGSVEKMLMFHGRTEACPNFKPLKNTLKFDPASFDDTIVDWDWFVPFCGWLSQISSSVVFPRKHDPEFFKALTRTADFSFFVEYKKQTRKNLMRWLLRDREWGGILGPIAMRGELKL